MSKTNATIIGTVVIALVSVAVWLEYRGRRLTAENQQLRQIAAQVVALREEAGRLKGAAIERAELERLQTSERRLREEVARLRGQLGARLREETQRESQAQKKEAQAATTAAGGMTSLFKGIADQQTQGRLARMKDKLNLTFDQEQAIAGILRQQTERGMAVAEKMFTGKLTREELQSPPNAGGNPDEQIRALLSPEQLAGYQEYQREEAVSNARLIANAELLQLQGAMTLKPEQQDQVFAALYDQTLAMFDGTGVEPPPQGGPDAIAEWRSPVKSERWRASWTPNSSTATARFRKAS
jgi:hypothetical protein